MELLLTPEQAAARLQISTFSVRQHLRQGKLRGIKRGRLWRVPESALLEAAPVQKLEESPLARALELVAQLEGELKNSPPRVRGINDAVTEMREGREERNP